MTPPCWRLPCRSHPPLTEGAPPTLPRAAFASSFARILARVVQFLAKELRIRRDTRQLMNMSDHMLKDIGLTRSQIGYAVRFGRLG
jgi:uncharacterized protein YjiS (DUF1127 family)